MQARFGLKASIAAVTAAVAMITGAVVLVGPGAGAGFEAQPGEFDATYVPVTPCRLFDLRPGGAGDRTAPLGPREVYTQRVTGPVGDCDVPADATGVAMNVTIVMPTAASHLTIFPADLKKVPKVSSLNWVAGQAPTPNAVNVKLSSDGKLKFSNLNGQVYVLADVVGYSTPTSLKTLTAQIAQSTIPSGTTVTGNFAYHDQITESPYFGEMTIDFPGVAPLPLDHDDVNFNRNALLSNFDADPTCTGTPEKPTAPPGKVCLYPSFAKNFVDVETSGVDSLGPLKDRGFGISIVLDPAPVGNTVILRGSWAYTAP